MKQVFQTRTGLGGNCFQACIASIFEMDLDDVPDFMNIKDPSSIPLWYDPLNRWLYKYGLAYIELVLPAHALVQKWTFQGVHIKICKSFNANAIENGYDHAVVGFQDTIIHDPDPSNQEKENTEYQVKKVGLFILVDPLPALKSTSDTLRSSEKEE